MLCALEGLPVDEEFITAWVNSSYRSGLFFEEDRWTSCFYIRLGFQETSCAQYPIESLPRILNCLQPPMTLAWRIER